MTSTSKETIEMNNLPTLLYVTPEQLNQYTVMEQLKKLYDAKKWKRLVIDEAHCVIKWTSFRISYNRLNQIKVYMPNLQIMAFTATATPLMRNLLFKNLHFNLNNSSLFVQPVNRHNL